MGSPMVLLLGQVRANASQRGRTESRREQWHKQREGTRYLNTLCSSAPNCILAPYREALPTGTSDTLRPLSRIHWKTNPKAKRTASPRSARSSGRLRPFLVLPALLAAATTPGGPPRGWGQLGGDHPPPTATTTRLRSCERGVGRPRGCVELRECVGSPLCPCVGRGVSPWSRAEGLLLLSALGSGGSRFRSGEPSGDGGDAVAQPEADGGPWRGTQRSWAQPDPSSKCVRVRGEEGWGAGLVPKPSLRMWRAAWSFLGWRQLKRGEKSIKTSGIFKALQIPPRDC